MAVALLHPPQVNRSPREWAVYWMSEWTDRGFPSDEAAEKAMEQLIQQGVLVRCPLVNECGAAWIADMFRQAQRDRRLAATYPMREPDDEIEDAVDSHAPLLRIPTTRRLPAIESVQGYILDELMFKIDGRWVRLGDITKAGADHLAAQHNKRATEAAQKAAMWGAIRDALGENETVRQHYTPDAIRALFAGEASA